MEACESLCNNYIECEIIDPIVFFCNDNVETNENIIKGNYYSYSITNKGKHKINFKDKIKYISFRNSLNLYSIDFTHFDTSNIRDMSDMFNQCGKLKEIRGINKFIQIKLLI